MTSLLSPIRRLYRDLFTWRKLKVKQTAQDRTCGAMVVGIVGVDKDDKIIWGIEDPHLKDVYFLIRFHEEYLNENTRGYWYFRHYYLTDGTVCYNVDRYGPKDRNVPDSKSQFIVRARPFFFSIPQYQFDYIVEACTELSIRLEEQQCSKIGM